MSTNTVATAAVGISPGKVTELRMKNLHELRELQALLEQNILIQEFANSATNPLMINLIMIIEIN